jgi:CubicO group peptidase (beta-lactamase class C family)
VPKLSSAERAGVAVRAAIRAAGVSTFAPAVGAALVSGDEHVVVVEGVRRLGHAEPAQLDDRFQLGSITKPLTGLMAGCVVHDKTLTYSRTLGQVHPDWFDLAPDPAEELIPRAFYRDVPLGDYMSHTSGILDPPTRDKDAEYFVIDPLGPEHLAAKRRHFSKLAVRDPPFGGADPRPKHLYGPGHVIASSIIESATGKRWEDLMTNRLFGRLGITNVSVREQTELFMHRLGAGGKPASFTVKEFETSSPQRHYLLRPTGAVALSMPEAVKLLRAVSHRDGALMGSAAWDACINAQPEHNFTQAGWSTSPGPGIVEHNGSYDGYYAYMKIDTTTRIGAVAATNSLLPGASDLVESLITQMFELAASW